MQQRTPLPGMGPPPQQMMGPPPQMSGGSLSQEFQTMGIPFNVPPQKMRKTQLPVAGSSQNLLAPGLAPPQQQMQSPQQRTPLPQMGPPMHANEMGPPMGPPPMHLAPLDPMPYSGDFGGQEFDFGGQQPHFEQTHFEQAPAPPSAPKEPSSSKQNPTIRAFGFELDLDSAVVFLTGIGVWISIWYGTGLIQEVERKNFVFVFIFGFFILYSLVNMYTSDSKSGSVVYELNVLLTVEQMVAIFFGTMALFVVFQDKLMADAALKPLIYRISVTILIVLSVTSLWINVFNNGRAFRAVRKAKQGLYNMAYMLFIAAAILLLNPPKMGGGAARAASAVGGRVPHLL